MNLLENLNLPSDLIYVREIDKSNLPKDVQNELADEANVFSIHAEDGRQVALMTDRRLAFDLAKELKIKAVSVH